jgi:hypothetical protein
MSSLKITRNAEVTFSVTDEELVQHVSQLPIDERLVLLRKLAGRDIEHFSQLPLISAIIKKIQ